MNPYNPDTNDGVILSEHKLVPVTFYRRIGIGFLVITTFIGFCWVTVYYYVAPQQYMAEVVRQLEVRIAEIVANDPGVQFTVVPTASTSVDLFEVDDQSVDTLKSDYAFARDTVVLGEDGLPLKEEVGTIDVRGVPYEGFANGLSNELQATLFQMHDEVREVARSIAEKNQAASLVTRIGESTQLLYPDLVTFPNNAVPAVYPNPFTLEAYLVTGLLARVLPDQAQYYEQRAEEIAMAGVAYGHYSIAEKDAMKAYIAWYLSEAEKNPAFPTLITSMQAIANQTVQ